MTSSFYRTFCTNKRVYSDSDRFCSFDNWLCDPISENWQLTLCSVCIFNEGKVRYLIVFPNGRKSWLGKPILGGKDYMHLCHMMEDIVQLRLDEHQQTLYHII